MKIKIQVIIESEENNDLVVEEIGCLQRGELLPESLGLTLQEGKNLLKNLQQTIVSKQIEEYITQEKHCLECSKERSKKGNNNITYRTVFGKFKIKSP